MSYISIHTHIVFATKNRRPMLDAAWRDRLHEYLGGTANGLDALAQGVGGVEDHVHLLIGFKASSHGRTGTVRFPSARPRAPESNGTLRTKKNIIARNLIKTS